MTGPIDARQFAVQVVTRLRDAGYRALWAGGCVRDQLVGSTPKDYDVATNATPDQIRDVFGFRRTLPIGKAFGVITVLGPKSAGQIEVATFRQDADYSDGRHPDRVVFSTPEEDAQRRDFTINGLFYDPLEDRIIDYVGGQQDLQNRVLRAIGDPYERIAEDKLRMLRAVRFAATYQLKVDPATAEAVQQEAHEITVVSAERIAAELRRMLIHQNRRLAIELLRTSSLMRYVLPEIVELLGDSTDDQCIWENTMNMLDGLASPSFAIAFAVLVRSWVHAQGEPAEALTGLCRRLTLSNEERSAILFFLRHEPLVRQACQQPWPRLQRVLIEGEAVDLVTYCQAVARVEDADLSNIEFCQQKLALPRGQLDPPPLIGGDELQAAGLRRGPVYGRILNRIRDAQLDGKIDSREQAFDLAQQIYADEADQDINR